MSDIKWTTETRRLGDLIPWEPNPRQLTADQAVRLRTSISEFGYSQLYEIEPDNTIIDGHQRDEIMLRMDEFGADAEIEVRVASRQLELDERKKYIAMKHKGAQGEWDWDAMHNLYEFDELNDWGFDADELFAHGFEEAEQPPDDPGPQVDRADELREKWGVELGQLWQLGEHRLICGDCTDADMVGRVMEDRAAITFTSPPYNAGISAELSGNTNIDDNLYGDEYDDNQKPEKWLALMNKFTALSLDCSDYVFVNVQSLAGNKKVLIDYWHGFVDNYADVAIWDKGHAAPQQAQRVMDSRFEFVIIFSHKANRAIGTRVFRGMVHNVYEGQPQRHNENADLHAATFPVDLPEHFIKTFTNDGELIYEPFCGTGTTICACERLNRKCRAVEISPAYCAVAIERWVEMTGGEPVLLDS